MSYQIETRKVANFPRPTEAPEGWEIYNAPRPLYGTALKDGQDCRWQGEFITGIFYAAIDPTDPDADLWREENRKQGATRLEFVSREAVVEEMVEYYKHRFPDRWEAMFEKNPLDQPKTQDALIRTWFNLEMNRVK